MAIAYTMTINAKMCTLQHIGLWQMSMVKIFLNLQKEAYCPTRIELDVDAKTILIKTRTHGTASYTFSNIVLKDQGVVFSMEKAK